MNVVQEIHRINARELASGSSASWHDQYKDSAYIYVGGLPYQLTEGDVITIFSQYGEVVDVSLPRDPATQKPKGFAFVMYADQRSTVLAVDNLGGAKVLERTLKVDHVLNYKQLERDQESGKMVEREEQRLAAHPDKFRPAPTGGDDGGSDSDSSHPSIDLDDPMRDYLIREKREARKAGGGGGKSKKRGREGETKEERRERRDKKKRAKEDKLAIKAAKSGKDKGEQGRIRAAPGRERERDSERSGGRERDEEDRYGSSSRRGDGDRRADYGRDRERDDYDSRRRDDRDERGDDRRRGYGDDQRHGDGDDRRRGDGGRDDRREERRPGGGDRSAFADLEKWAKGP